MSSVSAAESFISKFNFLCIKSCHISFSVCPEILWLFTEGNFWEPQLMLTTPASYASVPLLWVTFHLNWKYQDNSQSYACISPSQDRSEWQRREKLLELRLLTKSERPICWDLSLGNETTVWFLYLSDGSPSCCPWSYLPLYSPRGDFYIPGVCVVSLIDTGWWEGAQRQTAW
jgi:hypothetical protein